MRRAWHTIHVTLLGVALSALAASAGHAGAKPLKFDLICHYVRASGHEVWSGSPHYPYRGPRVRRMRLAIDLATMTQRELHHGLVPGATGIPIANASEIRLSDLPSMKEVVRRSDGSYVRTDVEDDHSLLIYRGRCKMAPFTPPGRPGQDYRGW